MSTQTHSAASPVLKDTEILRGSFRVLFFYDVAEAFDVDRLRQLLGERGQAVDNVFPRRTPEYVRFEQPPVTERAGSVTLKTGETAVCSIRYYPFAGVVLQLELPFQCDWNGLISQTSRWIDPLDIEPEARATVRRHLEFLGPAVIKPTQDWLQEDYLVINLERIGPAGGERITAPQLLSSRGGLLVQLVRGELMPLAEKACEEILQASISYYRSDLVVIASTAALVYDRAEDAEATVQVLEYTKLQLLEFRYYDALMSRVLSEVYSTLERKKNILFLRWSAPREAQRFNTLRLDVMELTERVDNAIKFVSDIYYAHVHRLAASRIGVNEYRSLVDDKLETAGQLYEFMADQFNEARSFIIELGVAILVLIDVILLLRGK